MPRPPHRVAASAGALVWLLCCAPAHAQTGSLTLQAAIDRALSANPTVASARLRGAIDSATLALARERLNPEVAIEFERETPRQAFGVAVPLELGGKRTRRIAVGEAAILVGQAEIAATIAQVRNDVRRAYYGVLAADARLMLLREIRDLSGRARDTAQARFDAGDAPRLEVLQAELALAAAENEATAAEGTAVAARALLNSLLAFPLDTVQPLAGPIDAGGSVSTPQALEVAQRDSTELAVLDRQIGEQRARLALAQALRVTDVTPTFSLTRDAQPEFSYGWRAGAAITVPLFTTHKAGVLVEQTTLDQLAALREATMARITGQVAAASVTVEAQRQLYVRYRDQVLPQAQQVEQLAQDSYQLGQTGIAALLQALQASRDVRLRSLDAVQQFQNALADLERSIGAPLP
ncbi:MAG: TolC family protein [Acidobacteria bacterium]|nr:TolC family protein [Acidobacteriota bacterium]